MKIWVIMGNDYPEAICSSQEKADRKINALKVDQFRRYGPDTRIHWRSYEFTVDG